MSLNFIRVSPQKLGFEGDDTTVYCTHTSARTAADIISGKLTAILPNDQLFVREMSAGTILVCGEADTLRYGQKGFRHDSTAACNISVKKLADFRERVATDPLPLYTLLHRAINLNKEDPMVYPVDHLADHILNRRIFGAQVGNSSVRKHNIQNNDLLLTKDGQYLRCQITPNGGTYVRQLVPKCNIASAASAFEEFAEIAA